MKPEYRESPTMTQAAGVVIVRFVIAMVSTLSATMLYREADSMRGNHYNLVDIASFVCASVIMSIWSVATLCVVACLQNWLGKTHIRITLKWSIVAGACYPLVGWLVMNFVDYLAFGIYVGIALFIVYPIAWGYIAFKSPELPPNWRAAK